MRCSRCARNLILYVDADWGSVIYLACPNSRTVRTSGGDGRCDVFDAPKRVLEVINDTIAALPDDPGDFK